MDMGDNLSKILEYNGEDICTGSGPLGIASGVSS